MMMAQWPSFVDQYSAFTMNLRDMAHFCFFLGITTCSDRFCPGAEDQLVRSYLLETFGGCRE